ncbi:hypothetical protein EAS54_16410 [Bradyrhizobium guangzhouense]|nr:hypothetical protein EAS54_16410 [Bradyrhizobium guangzhouense]
MQNKTAAQANVPSSDDLRTVPVWTSAAAFTTGAIELRSGKIDRNAMSPEQRRTKFAPAQAARQAKCNALTKSFSEPVFRCAFSSRLMTTTQSRRMRMRERRALTASRRRNGEKYISTSEQNLPAPASRNKKRVVSLFVC